MNITRNLNLPPGEIHSAQALNGYSGIYFLYQEEELVYVGQARNVLLRLTSHSKAFTSFKWIWVAEQNLSDAEAEYIVELQPPLNKNLPRNCRYKTKKFANKDCWKNFRRHATATELDQCIVFAGVTASDGQRYYDVHRLIELIASASSGKEVA